jgi:cyclic pyranopterin phosphate synthase
MVIDTLSRPLTDLRISVTDRCNFRCHYCMPSDIFGHDYVFLRKKEILSFEEITRLVRIFAQVGVSKIRLTGGEPLLRADLEVLIEMLSQTPGIKDIALTTNGYHLPEKAHVLRKAGLNRVTISLDTLKPDVLKELAGEHLELARVLQGITAAVDAGFAPIKLNTVIQKGVNDSEIVDLARFAKENGHIIRFIEYMDVGNLNGWRMNEVVSAREIVRTISAAMAVEPIDKNYRSEVANRYRYLDGGEFGIISSVTQPFCGDCTRARLSADGKIYTCLFAHSGIDIKTLLRSATSDVELAQQLTSIWKNRTDRYSEERASNTVTPPARKVEMYHIGG